MEALLNILNNIDEFIDWKNEKKLVDDRILDSILLISLIGDLEDAFDVEIRAAEIKPDNFNSAEAMWRMICRLRGETNGLS